MRKLWTLFVAALFTLSACSSGAVITSREPLTDDQRSDLYSRLDTESGKTLYSENGVVVAASRAIVVDSWKLSLLAEAYENQNDLTYVTDTAELSSEDSDDFYMASLVTTEDCQFEFRLTGDDGTITLDIRTEAGAGVLIVPRGCVLNGVVKDTTLFKGSEPDAGHFVITAQNTGFDRLALFGLSMENISSMAWLLTSINTETRESRDFMLAASFPVSEEWAGVTVAPQFSAASGVIMWIARQEDATYLCVFNGSESLISTDVHVSVASGSLISDIYTLNVSSGECAYVPLGYELTGVEVRKDDELLHRER
ncbi:hypothetical protein FACS1894208_09820 [Clostridia bacterium]|nr:hypothetical protein FACS1894208_09820 [Clostridia bacterium]